MAGSSRRASRRRQSWYGWKRPIKRVVSLPGVNQAARAITLRRRGPDAAARLPAPIGVKEVEGRINGLTFTMNDPAHCIIAKELYWGDGMRPRAQDQHALEVFARLSQKADKVLDIGCYTGVFAIVAAKANRAAEVHAFDIVPSNFLAAWGNVIGNDLVGRVEVHLQGVGADGSIRLPTATNGSALPDFLSIEDGEDSQGGVAIPVETLDRVLEVTAAEAQSEPVQSRDEQVLIKVDVEGHEAALVTAGRASIRAQRPTFLMEILPGSDVEPLLEVFGGQGYFYYLITEDRLREAARLRGEERYRDWLITTLPAERLTALGIQVDPLA